MNQKPENVIQGVGHGIQSIGNGLISGVTGVFTKPLEGFKNKGLFGGIVGLFKGATGLIINPIAGLLDAAS